jgi:hypothetical protein
LSDGFAKVTGSQGLTQVIKYISVILTIAQYVVLGATIIMGIKWALASAQEKATVKEQMIPYLLGTVIVFGASGIATIISNSLIDWIL